MQLLFNFDICVNKSYGPSKFLKHRRLCVKSIDSLSLSLCVRVVLNFTPQKKDCTKTFLVQYRRLIIVVTMLTPILPLLGNFANICIVVGSNCTANNRSIYREIVYSSSYSVIVLLQCDRGP